MIRQLRGRADRERGRRSGTRAEPGKAEEGGAVELRRPTTTRPGEGLPLPSGGTSRRRQGEGGAPWHATPRALSARPLMVITASSDAVGGCFGAGHSSA